uniref:Uncharacterized protein n=1 Tax=Hyaloperonospora arabidopsidis (strain Emoy2) TaxID=559515 RepID=M4BSD5_HYAAE
MFPATATTAVLTSIIITPASLLLSTIFVCRIRIGLQFYLVGVDYRGGNVRLRSQGSSGPRYLREPKDNIFTSATLVFLTTVVVQQQRPYLQQKYT